MTDSINKERIFNHDINKIWEAISNGTEITKWFLNADFKPEVGYDYTFKSEGEKCTTISGQVKKASPYTLVYTWIVEGTSVETTVTWFLEEIAEGTKLTLTHSGISDYGAPTAVEMMGHFSSGWDNCLVQLTAHLKNLIHAG